MVLQGCSYYKVRRCRTFCFGTFLDLSGFVRTYRDAFGYFRMRSDAFGSVRMVSNIRESFCDVLGCFKRLRMFLVAF